MYVRLLHRLMGLLILACLVFCYPARAQLTDPPAGFEPIERDLAALMASNGIPGASVAVAKDWRLVLARGYGLADRQAGEPVRPESLFRIASITKSITAVAVMQLVERGQLNLEAKAFELLPHIRPPNELIVTYNRRHYPDASVRPWGIDVQGPSAFLRGVYDLDAGLFVRKLYEQAAAIRVTFQRLLQSLQRNVPGFIQYFNEEQGIELGGDQGSVPTPPSIFQQLTDTPTNSSVLRLLC